MDLSDFLDNIREKMTIEDILLIALILVLIIEKKCDMIFIIILFIIFIAGFEQDLFSRIFELGFSRLPDLVNAFMN